VKARKGKGAAAIADGEGGRGIGLSGIQVCLFPVLGADSSDVPGKIQEKGERTGQGGRQSSSPNSRRENISWPFMRFLHCFHPSSHVLSTFSRYWNRCSPNPPIMHSRSLHCFPQPFCSSPSHWSHSSGNRTQYSGKVRIVQLV
jgi:hypothetical protein